MKIVIPSEKFAQMDKLLSKIHYKRAKPLIDFINSHAVEEDKIEDLKDQKK